MDFEELYQQVIIDHSKRPRNCRPMADASGQAEGYNPLCGDRITCFIKCEDDVVVDMSFQGSGCAISTAAASLLSEAVKGKRRAEVQQLLRTFHALVTGTPGTSAEIESLGKLAAFRGVAEFPTRVKCATLALHTMQAALEGRPEEITTE
ncbi:MAG: SUF system NifU family Fe-S cluster assembly protein [Planctomycetes bacterium]|nr:SUF system NifU family Fe-S cluster assembly protein [Planctomycetota bacterium]